VGTAILAFGAIQVLAGIQTYQGLLIGAALEGFYFGLFSTLAISFVQSFAKDRPARATALYWNSMMVTLVLAGPAAGIIAQIADFRTVIQIASGFALVSIVVLTLGSRFGAGADR
jgi:SET family sugar efflux transporter-like MFS transporter